MLATYFEWRVVPGREQELIDNWEKVTRAMHEAGSHGSALYRNDVGHYCAFARWPSRETRNAAFASHQGLKASALMRACIVEEVARIDMDEVSNLWLEK